MEVRHTCALASNSSGLVAVAPTDGTAALQSPPIPVPILGLPSLPSPLGVAATPTLVGTPVVKPPAPGDPAVGVACGNIGGDPLGPVFGSAGAWTVLLGWPGAGAPGWTTLPPGVS